jgi:opine dehydrogenase
MAADLTLHDHEVTLFSRTRSKVDDIVRADGIAIEGVVGSGRVPIAKVTGRLEEAMSEAELVAFPLPGMVQESYLLEALPHIRSHHVLWLCPGAAGSLIGARLLRERDAAPLFIETMSLPYAARMTGSASVAVTARAHVRCAAFPASRNLEAANFMEKLYMRSFPRAQNVLDTAINNVNYVIHPLPTVMNMGCIEARSGRFSIYGEGMTSSVQRAVYALDSERMKVAAAVGLEQWSIDDLYEEFGTGPIWRQSMGLESSERVEDRFLTEDVPVGLVLLASLGHEFGVETPLIDATIALADVLCSTDFRASGRTAATLGIAGMSKRRLNDFLADGA